MAIDFNADLPERRPEVTPAKDQPLDLSLLGQLGKFSGITNGAGEAQKGDEKILLAEGNCQWRLCYGPNKKAVEDIGDADSRLRKSVDKKEQELLEQGKYDKFLEQQRQAREKAKASRKVRTSDPRCAQKWDKLPPFCQPQADEGVLDQEPPPPRRTQ
jgi:hypothetical protein